MLDADALVIESLAVPGFHVVSNELDDVAFFRHQVMCRALTRRIHEPAADAADAFRSRIVQHNLVDLSAEALRLIGACPYIAM